MRIYPQSIDSEVAFQAAMFLDILRRTLSEILAEKHKSEMLTPAGLAKRMNTSPSQIGYLLEGTRGLDDEWLLRFCKAFDIAPIELLRRAFGDAVFLAAAHQQPRDAVPIKEELVRSIKSLKESVDAVQEEFVKSGLAWPEEKKTTGLPKTAAR